MKLQTKLDTKKSDLSINYNDSLFFMGSCFGENFSKIFTKRKFQTFNNPFGIVFNPISIFNNISQVLNRKTYKINDLALNNEVYNCFDFHSDMSALTEKDILNTINSKISETNDFIQKTTVLFLTLGTAWVYEYESNDKSIKIAANCHKFPSDNFKKRLLNIDEVIEKADEMISKLKEVNENLKIVFTISPVRHLKDGFVENNQSKAVLHLAVKSIIEKNDRAFYFPAYEYIIDELRDYRFFSKDMVHPNELAIEYVLEKFDKTYIKSEQLNTIHKIEGINKDIEHKVKFKETDAYKKFKTSVLNKMNELENLGFDFSEEKARFLD